MILYRAMCEEEYKQTLKLRKPDFSLKRFKYFSPSYDFILSRVKDGSFNNSRFVKDRYKYLMAFNIEGHDYLKENKEVQIDRRQNLKIDLLYEVI